MRLIIDRSLHVQFPGLAAILFHIEGIRVGKSSDELEKFKAESCRKFRAQYILETLKDVPELRAYRDFFWRVGIDPTKTRPASEALLRRVLQGRELPRINTLVDSYNIASMETHVPLTVFDAAMVQGDLVMRWAVAGEKFMGIGMTAEERLTGKEVVVEDAGRLVAIYPYRDADDSKVTLTTDSVVVLVCGVPGISVEHLENSRIIAAEHITGFCGGGVNSVRRIP